MGLYFDEKSQQIYNKNTARYFQEVSSSYYNGNYRSAIVMLYSVVIADILYKLDELSNIYKEEKATAILNSINTSRQSNPTSSDWEIKLLSEIKTANDFFDNSVHSNIEYLRKLRHVSAHPALNQSNELYLPNKETIACCIADMLEGVLIKPPILIKKVTDRLIEDISNLKDRFLSTSPLPRLPERKAIIVLNPQAFCKNALACGTFFQMQMG